MSALAPQQSEDFFEAGQIKADVTVKPVGSGHGVRVTILSGQDFRSAHISLGGVFETRAEADEAAEKALAACDLLGIPVLRRGRPTSSPLRELGEGDSL